MKTITIAVNDDFYQKVRVKAAEMGTNTSALVKKYLTSLVDQNDPLEARMSALTKARKSVKQFKAHPLLTREEIHQR